MTKKTNPSLAKQEEKNRLLVYGSYCHFIHSFKHFDSIQTKYRTIASTLLLATFAAIGFILSVENKILPFNRLIAVIVVSVISFVTIQIIWHLDLIFMERLLVSNFIEAYKLEKAHDWLPKAHHNMVHGSSSHGIPANKVIFYIGCGVTLIFVIAFALLFLTENTTIRISVSISTLLFCLIYARALNRKTGNIKKIMKEIKT